MRLSFPSRYACLAACLTFSLASLPFLATHAWLWPLTLIGTLLSGGVYQAYGLQACLWVSSAFVLLAALISIGLPRHRASSLME